MDAARQLKSAEMQYKGAKHRKPTDKDVLAEIEKARSDSGYYFEFWYALCECLPKRVSYGSLARIAGALMSATPKYRKKGMRSKHLQRVYGVLMSAHIDLNQSTIDFCRILYDAFTVTGRLLDSHYIYEDEYLSITYGVPVVDCYRQPELMIAVKDMYGVWSFHKDNEAAPVPVCSLRAARRAVQNYKGTATYKGEMIQPEARRLAKFLGLTIQGNWAYLIGRRSPEYKGFALRVNCVHASKKKGA